MAICFFRFPTVTICNSNKLKASLVRELDRSSDLYKMAEFENMNSVGLKDIYDTLKSKLSTNGEKETANHFDKHCNNSGGPHCDSTKATTSSPSDDLDLPGIIDRCVVSPWNKDFLYYIHNGEEIEKYFVDGILCQNSYGHNCLNVLQMCNDQAECQDGSDESSELCGECPPDEFQCQNGQCIDPKLRFKF